jgi:hypothetical protein
MKIFVLFFLTMLFFISGTKSQPVPVPAPVPVAVPAPKVAPVAAPAPKVAPVAAPVSAPVKPKRNMIFKWPKFGMK